MSENYKGQEEWPWVAEWGLLWGTGQGNIWGGYQGWLMGKGRDTKGRFKRHLEVLSLEFWRMMLMGAESGILGVSDEDFGFIYIYTLRLEWQWAIHMAGKHQPVEMQHWGSESPAVTTHFWPWNTVHVVRMGSIQREPGGGTSLLREAEHNNLVRKTKRFRTAALTKERISRTGELMLLMIHLSFIHSTNVTHNEFCAGHEGHQDNLSRHVA